MARAGGKKAKPGRAGAPRTKKPRSGRSGAAQERDLGRTVAWPVALVALLSLTAMLPLGDYFPSGNPMGSAGENVDAWLSRALGGGRFAVPFVLLAAGATAGRWWQPAALRRLWIVSVAAMALAPVAAFGVVASGPEGAASARDLGHGGWVGAALGGPLWERAGWLGAWVVVGGGAVATCVAAFGFNPLSVAASGISAAWSVASRAWSAVAGALAKAWSRRRERRAPSGPSAAEVARAEAMRADLPPEIAQDALGPDEFPGAVLAADADAPADVRGTVRSPDAVGAAASDAPPDAAELPDPLAAPGQAHREHELPGMELLAESERQDQAGMLRELDRLGEVLVETLETFKIRCEIVGRTTGPAVTQYEVVPAAGIKVNRIANLDADLALAMKARSVRIVAPIPGKGAVGVEIPNPSPEMVRLREILESPAFFQSKGTLPLALGKDLAGDPFVSDLAKMPHALIAGATGSGKSVCLNTIITSLVYRAGPGRLRLLLVDPKMVELSAYADLPHLRHPVVTDPRDAAGVLKWAVLEMERRYALLSVNGVRSLQEFNDRVERGVTLKRPGEGGGAGAQGEDGAAEAAGAGDDFWIYTDGPLPYVVVVVDELADLMMTVQAEVEKPLTQLAQKARAIGIHLLVATQRPSVNVVTGLIKANFPCRIAFRVASKTDSRTILDQNGADALLGHGDMLFLPPGQSEPVRMQGAFISTEETEALMNWYREREDALEDVETRAQEGEDDILEAVRALEGAGDDGGPEPVKGDWDPLFRHAAEACVQQGTGSTSLLQRRLSIGYGRAARIVDQLHEAGVLGPPDGSKPREVTADADALDQICPS